MDPNRFHEIGVRALSLRHCHRWKVEVIRRWDLDRSRGLVEIRDEMTKEGWPSNFTLYEAIK